MLTRSFNPRLVSQSINEIILDLQYNFNHEKFRDLIRHYVKICEYKDIPRYYLVLYNKIKKYIELNPNTRHMKYFNLIMEKCCMHTSIPSLVTTNNSTRTDTMYAWIDIETSGLLPEVHEILEISVIFTNTNLDIVSEYPTRVMRITKDTMDNISEWCKIQHEKSMLLKECRESEISIKDVDNELVDFMSGLGAKRYIICGNSVHFDKMFIRHHMPGLYKLLDYRIIDVSSINEFLINSGHSIEFKKYKKHRSKGDILESINEMRYYTAFNKSGVKTR